MQLSLPHDALVVVCDARKALFLRNEGDEVFPNLKVERHAEAPENGANATTGTDRPGRTQNAAGPASAVDGTDWHREAKVQFAEETMRTLESLHKAMHPPGLVLVAPPRMLAAMRECLADDMRATLLAEVGKDLTKHPVYEIERLLTNA
ncbi:protein required for attachment to host cells [Chelatococcus caeni]|uniref:Protein required for attachment to host cells n=1 Tax=Chelatococcus caeni TaxID=1348468 RepID=A0A840BRX2_9HYPH|nr:host attachment protein [Chelatococcus caeni]MBB4016135.1 protein required for attachment to host cells [Chelatococcus caeni]